MSETTNVDPSVIHLDTNAVKVGIENGSMLIIDVREPHEFAAGHIPGSLSMPLSTFDPRDIPGDTGKCLVFSCAAGVRSLKALEIAQSAGVDLHEHYIGGFKGWHASGGAVE